MYYEYTLTTGSGVVSGRCWMQAGRIRTESVVGGEHVVSLFDGDSNTITVYRPDRNRAFRFASEMDPRTALAESGYSRAASPADVESLGRVVCEGISCLLVAAQSVGSPERVRLWAREDRGLPVRMEISSTSAGKTVMEYKNLQFGPVPEGIFDLPAGVEVEHVG